MNGMVTMVSNTVHLKFAKKVDPSVLTTKKEKTVTTGGGGYVISSIAVIIS